MWSYKKSRRNYTACSQQLLQNGEQGGEHEDQRSRVRTVYNRIKVAGEVEDSLMRVEEVGANAMEPWKTLVEEEVGDGVTNIHT